MLDGLTPRPGSQHRRKRVGRGPGSGFNKTAGRGVKGQGTRAKVPVYFEGGQMPIARRLPKRGFTNIHRKPYDVVNVRDLAIFGEGATVDAEALAGRGLIGKAGARVKLLGDGDAPKGCTIKVHKASGSAVTKIEAAGGNVEIIG
jgi:large subunit ribosomal protein L15